jgi:hypothetical protein
VVWGAGGESRLPTRFGLSGWFALCKITELTLNRRIKERRTTISIKLHQVATTPGTSINPTAG